MSILTVSVAALALLTNPAPAPAQASPASVEDYAQARAVLAAQLPFYRETWFRNTRGNVIMFCGEMNTKTDLGAYTGWLRFLITHYGEGAPRLYIEGRNDGMLSLCDPAQSEAAPASPLPDYSGEMFYR